MKTYPLVSVIIPVYNHIEWLNEALESVMKQNYTNIEVIVINDGSTEDFSPFFEKYSAVHNVHYFYQENRGVAAARNKGIEKSHGEYIAFLDSDDIWDENKLSIQIQYMIDNDLVWSQNKYVYFDDKSRENIKNVNTKVFCGNIVPYIFTSCSIQTSCIAVKREVLTKCNQILFDEDKQYGEDSTFFLQLAQRYNIGFVDAYLTYYRIRGKNAGRNFYAQFLYRKQIYKQFHNDYIYVNNTSSTTKLAYKYCFLMLHFLNKWANPEDLIYAIAYFFPWIIFKINYRKLAKRRKDIYE